jgi:hypothetical protein
VNKNDDSTSCSIEDPLPHVPIVELEEQHQDIKTQLIVFQGINFLK